MYKNLCIWYHAWPVVPMLFAVGSSPSIVLPTCNCGICGACAMHVAPTGGYSCRIVVFAGPDDGPWVCIALDYAGRKLWGLGTLHAAAALCTTWILTCFVWEGLGGPMAASSVGPSACTCRATHAGRNPAAAIWVGSPRWTAVFVDMIHGVGLSAWHCPTKIS